MLGWLVAIVFMTSFRQYFRQYGKKENFLETLLNCSIATIIIFAFGILWLCRFMNFNEAIKVGLLPFIIPGIIKIGILSIAVRFIKFEKF